ncbi:phosphatase PAP2 family protein [Actinomadura sediminis]|uniref:Phosphatase PAP2 family protein n=1 Tax=Actinomadura sediminis TaxID=1038904 RepID=A0ABW3EI19_9ACTN
MNVPRWEGFALRASAGLLAVLGAAAGFFLLLGAVEYRFRPLIALDRTVGDALNDLVAANGLLVGALHRVTDLGGRETSTYVLVVVTAFLLIRRRPRPAVYVVVTAMGTLVLSPALKVLVGRLRPVVDTPVADAPGMSFPSGHALSSTVCYGVLLLVFLPTVRRGWRPALIATVAALVLLIGFTRVALGVHFLSDVVAGWLLGVLWLGVTAVAFRRWLRDGGTSPPPIAEGLEPGAGRALRGAPEARERTEHLLRGISELAVGGVLIFGVLFGAGLLVTEVLSTGSVVVSADRGVAQWMARHRVPPLTDVSLVVTRVGGTRWIVTVLVTVCVLVLALLRRWRPVLFLLVVVGGETLLFLASSAVVSRGRPAVPHAGPELPPTSSFPSGHVAATACLYGAIALLAWRCARRRWRLPALAAAIVLPVVVAFTRLYGGVHYLTDVLGSLLLASLWLALCWWVIRPTAPPAAEETPAPAGD